MKTHGYQHYGHKTGKLQSHSLGHNVQHMPAKQIRPNGPEKFTGPAKSSATPRTHPNETHHKIGKAD